MKRKIPLGQKRWKEIIRNIETHNQGLADTLAIMADPDLQKIIKESDKEIKSGTLMAVDLV